MPPVCQGGHYIFIVIDVFPLFTSQNQAFRCLLGNLVFSQLVESGDSASGNRNQNRRFCCSQSQSRYYNWTNKRGPNNRHNRNNWSRKNCSNCDTQTANAQSPCGFTCIFYAVNSLDKVFSSHDNHLCFRFNGAS